MRKVSRRDLSAQIRSADARGQDQAREVRNKRGRSGPSARGHQPAREPRSAAGQPQGDRLRAVTNSWPLLPKPLAIWIASLVLAGAVSFPRARPLQGAAELLRARAPRPGRPSEHAAARAQRRSGLCGIACRGLAKQLTPCTLAACPTSRFEPARLVSPPSYCHQLRAFAEAAQASERVL